MKPEVCPLQPKATKLWTPVPTPPAEKILRTISGYAVQYRTYGLRDADKDGKRNVKMGFLPGAFDAALRRDEGEVLLTQDMDSNIVFASRRDGTLILTADDVGLLVTAHLLDSPQTRLLLWKIDHGLIRGWSAKFPGFPLSLWSIRQDGEFQVRDYRRASVSQVTLVVHKMPRLRDGRTEPTFILGGPQEKELAHAE